MRRSAAGRAPAGKRRASIRGDLGQLPGVASELPAERPSADRRPVGRSRRPSASAGARPPRSRAARGRPGCAPPSRVVSAVTSGLPSRSPPTHDPQRRNGPTRGGRVPVAPLSRAAARRAARGRSSSAASSARYSRGVTTNSDSSKNAITRAHLVERRGRSTRSAEVRHSSAISSRSRRRTSASSAGVRRGSSSRSSRPIAAAERDEQRAAPRLGGMRREDEPDREPVDDRPAPLARRPSGGGARPRRRSSRRAMAAGGRRGPLAQAPDALLLLGQVGELEVEAEGPDEAPRPPRVDPVEDGAQRPPLRRSLPVRRSSMVAAPDALDERQEVLALLLHDDLAQERAEQLDLARERVARAARVPMPRGSARTAGLSWDTVLGMRVRRLPCSRPPRYLQVHDGDVCHHQTDRCRPRSDLRHARRRADDPRS